MILFYILQTKQFLDVICLMLDYYVTKNTSSGQICFNIFWKRLHLPAICLACEIKLIGYFYRRDRQSASIRYKWTDRNKYIYYFVFRSIVELLEENKIKVQELSMNKPCAKIENLYVLSSHYKYHRIRKWTFSISLYTCVHRRT